jgi:predicted cupin superfamily sugar epimerase
MRDKQTIIETLGLQPHPEGGFYKETYRSDIAVKRSGEGDNKSALTSIYYLLDGNDFSAWHRIKSDETWYFHLGCDLCIYFFDEHKSLQTVQLGLTAKRLQTTVPANTWFAAKPTSENEFCLVSCAVAPGFEFNEFEIAEREALTKQFGKSDENIEMIQKLTRLTPARTVFLDGASGNQPDSSTCL